MDSSDRRVVVSPVSPGDVVAGKYRIERVLGSGGMGVVVAASQIDLGRPVALKFISPEGLAGRSSVERFMREAQATVRLKSEHVARVYDVGHDGEGRPFIVLELLEGMDLAQLHRQVGPLPIADGVEYVLQACEALVEAHGQGIVHRDLKPQNLFVTRRLNGTPLVKVLDFGISKMIGPAAVGQLALTDTAAVMGSPLYMSPEQMRSARSADVRSDIWALGVILYELLTGQLPFDGETVTELCLRVANDPPPLPQALRPGMPPALVLTTMRCLEKDPAARFQNVAQLASALEPFSRSAQHGGVVRPWRHLDDTHDSCDRPKAEATGPSTAVSVPDAGSLVREPPAPNTPNRALASTDVTWGQARGTKAPARGHRAAAWGAVALGLAAAAVAMVAPRRAGAPVHAASQLPEPVVTVVADNDGPPLEVGMTAASFAVAPPAPEKDERPPAPEARRGGRASRIPPAAVSVSSAVRQAGPPSTPAPPAEPSAPAPPNGAPILR